MFVAGGAAAAIAHFAVPSGDARGLVYLALGGASLVALAAGVRGNHPENRLPWVLLGAGLTVFFAGDLIFYWYQLVRHVDRPFPSVADAFYLSSYPLLSAGLVVIARRRNPGGDRAGIIDASIVATAMGLLVVVYAVAPALETTDTPMIERIISAVYPLSDVVLLAVAARLVPGGIARAGPYVLLLVAIAGLLCADLAYLVAQLAGSFDVGTAPDAGWMAFYLCLGAAALHPSMTAVGEPAPPVTEAGNRVRLLVLGAVLLVTPTVIVIEHFQHDLKQLLLVAAATALLSLLVVARLAGLMGSLGDVAARERILRDGAAALGAAADHEAIYAATLATARGLMAGAAERVHLAMWSGRDVLDAAFPEPDAGDGGPAVPLPSRTTISLDELDALLTSLGEGQPSGTTAVVTPVMVQDELQGAVVVVSDPPPSAGVCQGLDTLASQVGTALARVLLTAELHQRRGEARFRSLVQNSSDVITVVDADSTIRYQSPSALDVLGYGPAALVGERLVDLVHADDRGPALSFIEQVGTTDGSSPPMPLRIRRPDGSHTAVEAIGNNLLGDANVGGIVVTLRDIREREAFQSEIRHQSLHDALTGLPNRALLTDRVENALRRRAVFRVAVSVVVLDLDDFKVVNDSLGPAAGDEVLVAVASRLAGSLGPTDTLARLGGDEFAVLLEEASTEEATTDTARRIMEGLRPPFEVSEQALTIRASVGIAIADDVVGEAENLIRNAEVAMHAAKQSGKGRYEVFAPRMHEAVLHRLHLTADLQRALQQDQLVLHYQPIVALSSGHVVGFEALVRWNHPTRGLVGPNDFIPLAEETNLILPLGRWVMETAFRQARSWHRQYGTTMSVNLSRQQLAQAGLAGEVDELLRRTGVPPGALTMEVTESVVMQEVDAAASALGELRDRGVQVAIDDFGTGYSSLATLRQLPVDVLKIDKAFIDGVASDADDTVLVGSVIELAHGLGLVTVAEGIETDTQMTSLRRLRCVLGQGFHIARPMPAAEAERFLLLEPDRGGDEAAPGNCEPGPRPTSGR